VLALIVIVVVVLVPLALLVWRLRRNEPDMDSGGSDGKQIRGN